MPRVSREQAEKNRETIEEVSARLFREQGIHGVSVADLMAAAGLTHGGFYGHFESKDVLAAAACERAFAQSARRWRAHMAAGDARLAWRRIVNGYLDEKKRDHAGTSCPAASLAADVAREPLDKPVHASYVAGVKRLADSLESLHEGGDPAADREGALARLATLVGALLLSRATRADPISGEILAAARKSLLAGDAGAVAPAH